jgi:hypothetical protein
MTPLRSFFSWILSKFWSVVVVFVILGLSAFVVGKFNELKQLDQTIIQFKSIEGGVKGAAESASTEAQARIKELDHAAKDAVERRVQTLNAEIKQLMRDQSLSPAQRAIAIARGDMQTLSDWASKQVTLLVKQEEHDVLARILDYRSTLDSYQRRMHDGPAELERLRLEHVAEIGEFNRLGKERDQLVNAHPVLVNVPGTEQYKSDNRLLAERTARSKRTHALRAKYDELSASMLLLAEPRHPGTLPRGLKLDPLLKELGDAREKLQAKLGDDFLWRVVSFDFKAADLVKAAVVIVAVASLVPLGIKVVLFYVLAPLATRRPGVALLPDSGGRVLVGKDLPGQTLVAASSVSCPVTIDSSNELLVHSEYLQSLPNACKTRTQWILDHRIPLSSIAAGLCVLMRMRAETPQTVVVSSTRDPLSEVSLVMIPEGSSVVLLSRHIVGVVQARGAPLRITRRWRLFSLHAWLTLQLRYLLFHGPVTLVVKGCRGVRVEAAESGRSLNPAATMGFSTNLRYASRRCETLFSYLSGRQPLLNDSFAGGSGYYIYQEMPYQRRGGIFERGLEGLLDAALKPLGI